MDLKEFGKQVMDLADEIKNRGFGGVHPKEEWNKGNALLAAIDITKNWVELQGRKRMKETIWPQREGADPAAVVEQIEKSRMPPVVFKGTPVVMVDELEAGTPGSEEEHAEMKEERPTTEEIRAAYAKLEKAAQERAAKAYREHLPQFGQE